MWWWCTGSDNDAWGFHFMWYVFDSGYWYNVTKKYIKNTPTNIIICPPQGIIHRTTQANVYSSVVSRHSKVSDSSSLTSSICRRSGRDPGVRNRSKFQLIFYELVNCGSHNQQLLTLKEELRNPDIRKKRMSLLAHQLQIHYLTLFIILLVFLILWSNVMVIREVHVKHGKFLFQKQVFMVRLIPMRSVKAVKEKSQSIILRKLLQICIECWFL